MSMPPPPPGYGPSGERAGFWIRFAGALIDGLLLGVVNSAIEAVTDRWTSFAVGTVIGVIYTVYFIGSPSGQTVGMHVVGIRVIDASDGGRVDYGRCVTRHIVAFFSGLALLLGYLWMLWDPERQTWHDKAANTFVVPVTDYPIERWPG